MAKHQLMLTVIQDGPSASITPENVTKDKDLILKDHRLTIQVLCNALVLSYGTCQQIL
jgi:hypothetical protein